MISLSRWFESRRPRPVELVLGDEDNWDRMRGAGLAQTSRFLSAEHVQDLTSRATLVEAAVAAIGLVVDVPVHYARCPAAITPFQHTVSFSPDNTLIVEGCTLNSDAIEWLRYPVSGRDHTGQRAPNGREARTMRLILIQDVLTGLRVNHATIDEAVRTPYTATTTTGLALSSALPLWWAARLAEGHTQETAWTMLGLVSAYRTWSALTFPPDGGAPILDAA